MDMRVFCALSDPAGFSAALAVTRPVRAQDFSVAETAQFVEASTLPQIASFDCVTARDAWRAAALAGSGAIDPSQTPDASSALSFRQSGGGPQRPLTRTSGGT